MMEKGWKTRLETDQIEIKNEDLADFIMCSRMYSRESRYNFRSVYVWVIFVPVQDEGTTFFHEKRLSIEY